MFVFDVFNYCGFFVVDIGVCFLMQIDVVGFNNIGIFKSFDFMVQDFQYGRVFIVYVYKGVFCFNGLSCNQYVFEENMWVVFQIVVVFECIWFVFVVIYGQIMWVVIGMYKVLFGV